jgi:voltage-gated potassium channel Kch
MRTPTFRERLRYRFDAFMSRGTLALILGLFALSALLIVGVSVVIWVVGQVRGANGLEDMTLPEVIWASLLRTLDSGTMGGDTGTIGWLLAMLLVTLGGIFIVATLIGIISSGLEGRLDELRKGRSRVIEEGHTVILGWSRSIFTIVEELIEANANKRRQHIVILADRDKIEMEDELRARITDRKSTTIVCRSGSPIDLDEIDIASHQTSRAVIVLAPDTDDPDADVLKTLLAITNDPDRRPEPYHVVVELSDPRNVEVARMVGKDEVEIVLVGDLIARVTPRHAGSRACRSSTRSCSTSAAMRSTWLPSQAWPGAPSGTRCSRSSRHRSSASCRQAVRRASTRPWTPRSANVTWSSRSAPTTTRSASHRSPRNQTRPRSSPPSRARRPRSGP